MRAYYPRDNTCRFCKKTTWSSELIKYGTRAYAHPACYAEHKTMQDAASLPLMEKQKLDAFIGERAAIAKAERTT